MSLYSTIRKWNGGRINKNLFYEEPYEQLKYSLDQIMWNNRSTIHNLIDVGKRFTFDDFVEYSHNFLKSGKHLWFGIGNIRADPEMIRIAKTVKEIMNTQPLKIEDMYPIRILKLAPNIELYSQIEIEDEENTISSAIVCHFQYGYSKSMENDILYQILFQIIDEPTFDFLRTQEQLGYLAYSKSWLFRSVRGGGFVIQSSNKGAEFMNSKVHELITIMEKKLEDMSDEEFIKNVKSVLTTKEQIDMNLSDLKGRMHNEILFHTYEFDKKEKVINILKQIIEPDNVQSYKAKLVNIFKTMFVESPRKLTLQITSPSHKTEQETFSFSVPNLKRIQIPTLEAELDDNDNESILINNILEQVYTSNGLLDSSEDTSVTDQMYFLDIFQQRWINSMSLG